MKKRPTDEITNAPINEEEIHIDADNEYVKLKFSNFLKKHYRTEDLPSLAKEIGCSLTSLRSWTYGSVPSFKNIEPIMAIARKHNVSLETLLFDSREADQAQIILTVPIMEDGNIKLTLKVLKEIKSKGDL